MIEFVVLGYDVALLVGIGQQRCQPFRLEPRAQLAGLIQLLVVDAFQLGTLGRSVAFQICVHATLHRFGRLASARADGSVNRATLRAVSSLVVEIARGPSKVLGHDTPLRVASSRYGIDASG